MKNPRKSNFLVMLRVGIYRVVSQVAALMILMFKVSNVRLVNYLLSCGRSKDVWLQKILIVTAEDFPESFSFLLALLLQRKNFIWSEQNPRYVWYKAPNLQIKAHHHLMLTCCCVVPFWDTVNANKKVHKVQVECANHLWVLFLILIGKSKRF